MRLLSLYDYSGNWSQPYKEAGWEVTQVDLKYDGVDVRLLKRSPLGYDGILAAPPCTVFAGSGARWPRTNAQMVEGLSCIDAVLRLVYIYKPKFWALENPVGKLVQYLGKPRYYFQPWEHGDPYTKRTCLWGEFTIPDKHPVEPVEGGKIHRMGPSPDRQEKRSVTPMGFSRDFYRANSTF